MSERAPQRRPSQAPASDAAIALGIFAFGLALSLLFDFGRLFGELYRLGPMAAPWRQQAWLYASCGAALWLLLRPRSWGRLALFCGLALLHLVDRAPALFNHSIFAVAIYCALLVAIVAARPAAGGDVGQRIYERVAPVLRVSLLVLYGWVFVHKLNWDFLDPSVSCATAQVYQLKDRLPWLWLPGWLPALAVGGTLAIEAALPVGLALSRWRRHALLLGGAFHVPLALHYPGFSVMLFALYTLFVPRETLVRAVEPAAQRLGWLPRMLAAPSSQGLAWLVLVGLAVFFFGERAFGAHRRPDLAFALTTVALAGYLLRLWSVRTWGRPEPLVAGGLPWLWILPVLMLGNGALPYLGVKNTQVFAMFSNLRTEGGQTNHLFLPASLQVSPVLRDVVRVRVASDPYLDNLSYSLPPQSRTGMLVPRSYRQAGIAELAPRAAWLPYEGLRHRVSHLAAKRPERVVVEYERQGVLHSEQQAHRSELATAPRWRQKFWRLRAVALEGPAFCMW